MLSVFPCSVDNTIDHFGKVLEKLADSLFRM